MLVTFTRNNRTLCKIETDVKEGITLLQLLNENSVSGFDAPCGGNGTCGKCRIRIISGEVNPPDKTEQKHLTSGEFEFGIRLACFCIPLSDVTAEINTADMESAEIADKSLNSNIPIHSVKRYTRLSLKEIPQHSLENQKSMLTKIIDKNIDNTDVQGKLNSRSIPFNLIRNLKFKSDNKDVILRDGTPVLLIEPEKKIYGIAVDIGTTTIVLYLIDLLSADILDTFSAVNSQKSFGADVISRISFAEKSEKNKTALRDTIVGQLESGINNLAQKNAIENQQILQLTIAGNTTMLHLLTGADCSGISSSPFVPVFTDLISCSAAELGFKNLPAAYTELMPSISAYIGADITAGIHVTGLNRKEKPAILLDIGTNGEIAVGFNNNIICCSTAAGPAFEGANIHCGIGGVAGAVDSVDITESGVCYTTIRNKKPLGICGSGIIDAAAALIRSGLVDYTGRLLGESRHPNFISLDGEIVFVIAPADETDINTDIIITQKDIREIQLAKAAIAAGIKTLLYEAQIKEEDVEKLYLAGGFGTFISPLSAGVIGLIPEPLVDRTLAVGNSSGEGAVCFSSSQQHYDDIIHIAEKCRYIELSANMHFQKYLIDEISFPGEK